MDLNRATILGRLTRDPEVRTTTTGKNVTSFSVATSFAWKDQSGEKKESVEYHNVIAWRKLGEIVGQYMKKGSRVLVEGRLQTRSWDGQDGSKKNRTEIIAENLIMLDNKGSGGGSTAYGSPSSPSPAPTGHAEPENVIQIDESETADRSPRPAPANAVQNEEEISVEDIPF